MTNLQRIKQMSAKELAKMLCEVTGCDSTHSCRGCPLSSASTCDVSGILEWLNKEAIEHD